MKSQLNVNDFLVYIQLGFNHISDVNAYDHIVFLLALIAVYSFNELKKIALLVTAFTLGHSVSLALATFKVILVSSNIIEFLIPITILITALGNIVYSEKIKSTKKPLFDYTLVALFGIIHGMGFSNYLQTLLSKEADIILPLFSFNLGLELGQLLIVAILLMVKSIGEKLLHFKQREWTLFISGAASGIAIILINETRIW